MEDLIKAAVLLRDCIKYEQLDRNSIEIPDNSKCYYSDQVMHMHREMWAEENMIIFYRSEEASGCSDIIRTKDSHKRIFFYAVSLDASMDREYISVLSDFIRLPTEDIAYIRNIMSRHSVFEYSELVRVSELLAFT